MDNNQHPAMSFTDDLKSSLRIAYALRRVPQGKVAGVVPGPDSPRTGDIVLAEVEKIGKNASLELADGRSCKLHVGDRLAVVFGNRYATMQFEGYAHAEGKRCDLLSKGGVCGLVASKHAAVPDPTKLRLLGAVADEHGHPLRLREFALAPAPARERPRVIVVCGTSMDAGKTHTATSLIKGLQQQGCRVAGIKLTGTATGKDTWSFLDAGACAALNFVDGGYPSTYLCTTQELVNLYNLLLAHAASHRAEWAVVEIADGLLQVETASLLKTKRFSAAVDAWIFAAGDPMGAAAGLRMLQSWGISPLAISGIVCMSPLAMKEAEAVTGLPCLSSQELERGRLTAQLLEAVPSLVSA